MKTQFRDPDGLLNCLSNTPSDSPVFKILIESAEEFDPCMIRRTQQLTIKQRSQLMKKATNPLSLQSICRAFFRSVYGRLLPEIVPQLDTPKMLHRYLLFETYWLQQLKQNFTSSFWLILNRTLKLIVFSSWKKGMEMFFGLHRWLMKIFRWKIQIYLFQWMHFTAYIMIYLARYFFYLAA